MQRVAKKLILDIMWERVDFSPIVKEHADTGCPLAIDQLAGRVGVMVNQSAQVQLADVKHLRAGREIELNYRWLVVNSGNEAYFGIKVSLCHAMAGIDIEPVVRVGEAAAQGSIVPLHSRSPGLGVISA